MKIYTIAETAGIQTIPHGGAGTPWGQHVAMAAPESPIAECWTGSPPGLPLEELNRIPGMATAKNGFVTPSDAPGFGMEIPVEWVRPWEYKSRS